MATAKPLFNAAFERFLICTSVWTIPFDTLPASLVLPCCKMISGKGFLIGFFGKTSSTGTCETPNFFSESSNFIVSPKLREDPNKIREIKNINL